MRYIVYTFLAIALGYAPAHAQQMQGGGQAGGLQGAVTPQGTTPHGMPGMPGQGLQGIGQVPPEAGQVLQRRGGAGPSQHFLQNQQASQNPVDILQSQEAAQNQQFRRQGARPNVDFKQRDPTDTTVRDRLRQAQQQGQGQQGQNDQLSNQLLSGGGGGGGGYNYNMFGAATPTQAGLMGVSEVVRSAGEANRNTAAAEVLHQRAIGESIQNRRQAVNHYFEVRALNRDWQQYERGPRATQEDAYRYSQAGVPDRLPMAQLDRVSGAIRWPAVLQDPIFAEHRARLEQIFQGRTYYQSGITSQSYLEIKHEADAMLATLQDYVRYIDPMAYVQARNFIRSLGYEGQFVASNDGLALR